MDIKERFLSHISKANCWIWTAAKGKSGYGRFKINGKLVLPHRFSYECFIGCIPKGYNVCHRCDNRLCVNPEHLFIATQSTNMKDCYTKGRSKINKEWKFGEENPNAKLSNTQVKDIKQLLNNKDLKRKDIAEKFCISDRHLRDIARNKFRTMG